MGNQSNGKEGAWLKDLTAGEGQLGREAVMSGVSIEDTGRASKFIGRRSNQARIENPRKLAIDKYDNDYGIYDPKKK